MSDKLFQQRLKQCPIIAIIRGITPEEIANVTEAILLAGIKIIEVPLNSPNALASLNILRHTIGDRGICGAGTVTTPHQVTEVAKAGGQLIISPNCDPNVINATRSNKMISVPGCMTPTEVFTAIDAGSRFLKIFPIDSLGTKYLKSLGAVLPNDAIAIAVGGVNAENMEDYWAAGARGFGVANKIYNPGDTALKVRENAIHLAQKASCLKA